MIKPNPNTVPGLNLRLNAMLRPALGICMLGISALSLGLFSDVSFGASYQVAPRIAPRDRGSLPKAMPEPRIDVEPAPTKASPSRSTSSSVQQEKPTPANEIPAMTVEITKVAAPPAKPIVSAPAHQAVDPMPASAPAKASREEELVPATQAAMHAQPAGQAEVVRPKPEQTAKADNPKPKSDEHTRKISHGKKPHPIVIAPEPLLPSEIDVRTAGLPQPSGQITHSPTASSNPKTSSSATTRTENRQRADSDYQASSAKPDKTAQSVSDAEMRRVLSSTPTYTAPAHRSSSPNGWEPGFYPVGFTPAVRPVTPEKVQALGDALSHYNRGVYYTQRKQWEAAVNEYKQVLSRNMNMADAYVGLSTAAIYQHDWENALKNSVKALRLKSGFLDPANITQARYNLSSVYCVSNDYHKALKYFKQVQKDNHPEADALWTFLQSNCKP